MLKGFLGFLLIFLTGCQLAMKYPELPEVEKVPALPPLYKQRPIAFEKAVIDLPRGQTYIAYPYWRWSFDNVDIGLFGACNTTSKNRFGNSSVSFQATGNDKFHF